MTFRAGGRNAYQLSKALEKAGLLESLVPDLFLSSGIVRKVLRKYTDELPYNKVKNSYSKLMRQKLFKQTCSVTDQILINGALKQSLKHNANLFLYSYMAPFNTLNSTIERFIITNKSNLEFLKKLQKSIINELVHS